MTLFDADPWGRTRDEQYCDALSRVAALECAPPRQPGTLAAAEHGRALLLARWHLARLRQLTLPGFV